MGLVGLVWRAGGEEGGRMASGRIGGPSAPPVRRDPYEVLCVSKDSSDQDIKAAYRKLALKLVPFSSIHSVFLSFERVCAEGPL